MNKQVSNRAAKRTQAPGKRQSLRPKRYLKDFDEIVGRTIASVEHQANKPDDFSTVVEIRFTDGTALIFGIGAIPTLDVQFVKDNNGNLKPLSHYQTRSFGKLERTSRTPK